MRLYHQVSLRECLADIRWGRNKDNEQLQNTLEVVVYSLDTHEPIYYRTFAGNENDSRTLRTIINDQQKLARMHQSSDCFRTWV